MSNARIAARALFTGIAVVMFAMSALAAYATGGSGDNAGWIVVVLAFVCALFCLSLAGDEDA